MNFKNVFLVAGAMLVVMACQIQVPDKVQVNQGGGNTNGNENNGGSGGGNNSGGGGGEVTPPPDEPPPLPKTVEFVIKPGTGNGAWNDSDHYVELQVGDTLRIRNMDSQNHELHMPGNSACPHGNAPIPTGGVYDCVTKKAFETNKTKPQSYDHIVNSSVAAFFFKVMP